MDKPLKYIDVRYEYNYNERTNTPIYQPDIQNRSEVTSRTDMIGVHGGGSFYRYCYKPIPLMAPNNND